MRWIAVAALAAGLAAGSARAVTTTVYNLELFLVNGVTAGTVTTDGSIGELGLSDITNWDISLGFPHSGGAEFQPAYSVTYTSSVSGDSGIFATIYSLYFNFGGAITFGFKNLLDGSDLQFNNGGYGVVLYNGNTHTVPEPQKEAMIASISPPPGPTPEPSTWGLLLVGLFGTGALMRLRRAAQPTLDRERRAVPLNSKAWKGG